MIVFAWDVGILEVIVACESQIVADALYVVSDSPTVISNIIEGICHKLLEFRQVQISHFRRQGNWPIHILAQYVKNMFHYVTWI